MFLCCDSYFIFYNLPHYSLTNGVGVHNYLVRLVNIPNYNSPSVKSPMKNNEFGTQMMKNVEREMKIKTFKF